LQKGEGRERKKKEPETEAGGSQYPEERIKTSKETNRTENVQLGSSVA